ncbi:hypothetical protein AA11826_0977 [Komagataeibacter oboediens DSM 11826]|uniref:Peptidase S74 domain-containing protein n=1 Tax=Komagataeibacter oboediens TaxID=65958 RepID=A0A318QJ76_9PROT|nr:hypothetical protein [Komagataeibacter oboediens]PYD78470.1 hypothetical protein CFR80_16400 [Komagataeibacter oboediens]GBR32736.1 hypothetical protein AA11826_0977 [Komagataeibacter oboediens DSM 11826]
MTGITIPQLPDGATLDDTDLLEIVRTAEDGTQSSMRITATYVVPWLAGKDLSQSVVVPAGSAAGTTGTALADIAATANGAVQSSQIGVAGGVTGMNAEGASSAPNFTATGSGFAVQDVNGLGLRLQSNGHVYFTMAGLGGIVIPDADNTTSLGVSAYKWANVVSVLATVTGIATVGGLQTQYVLGAQQSTGNMQIGAPNPTGSVVGFVCRNQGNIYFNSYDIGTNTPGGYLLPGSDNVIVFGASSNRIAQIFAGTAAINTSDATEKTLASAESPFTLAQIKVALRPLLTRLYQWNDMIAKKGADKARYHVGYLAQDVFALLTAANIDPTMTALWCNDALTQNVLVTPGKEAVTTTDPETGEVTVVTPAVDPVYEDQPILNADGTQKYRQGLRMELVHAVLIDDSRDRIATLENNYAALLTRVAALEAK